MKPSTHAKPLRGLLSAFLIATLLAACNDSKTTTEETKTTTAPATTAPVDTPLKRTDSLPPIDDSARDRPDNIKTEAQ